MSDSRRTAIWDLVAAHAAARDQGVTIADVCAVASSSAQVSGAWVIAASAGRPGFVICVSDPVSERLAELQLTVGEGPCHDVLATGAPVLTRDLDDDQPGRRWPVFTPEACQAGAVAVFAFPLTVGVIRAGVLGLYRTSPGPLDSRQLGDCLLLADTATVLLLDGVEGTADGGSDGRAPDLVLHRAEIDQATGMVMVQVGVTAAEAFARLRAYAYAKDRRLADVASDIVGRRLRLQPDPPAGGGP
jgi:GAF domain-containing protein